ncbi:unnamed protein product [Aphis gossypii]|uniref:Uncharacterized protein n=1 Tax=Aphis gossypii TaxID=80765 RepID=A0A9P0NHH0_APHGO|nr:unnamed protein product [Aphis gossypii]
MSVAAVVGRLETIRYDGRNSTVLYNITTTVGGIISSFENSSSSLGKGVMVVAIHWSRGVGDGPNGSDGDGGNGSVVNGDDVPYGFLRNLQTRYKQPVYAVDLHRLLSDGRSRDTDSRDGSLPQPCRRPVDHGLGSLLPLRSRYVVLYRGIVPPDWDPDPFVELAQLNYTFWDVDVYYLIVAVNGFDYAVRRMVYGVWRDLSIYKIIVVTQTVIKILDPFADNAVDGRFLNVPPRSLRRIPSILHSRIGNLRRFPLRFIVNNRIPTVIAMRDGTFVGQDGAFATVLAAKMNATPVYISHPSANGKIYYGYRWIGGRAYGTFAGVIDGWADVSINGHFLKDYNCYLAELTRHITSDKVCLLTPKAGVIPPMMTVLMSFQREVWMMTAITCVLVTVIYFATAAAALDTHRQGPTGCNLGLEIYRMFIGAPTNRIFAYSCHRILTSFCLFFTLVILNAFQVIFFSTAIKRFIIAARII